MRCYGRLARAGKVKNQTPSVVPREKCPKKKGRAKYRAKFNKMQNGQLKSNSELNQIRDKKIIEAEAIQRVKIANLSKQEAEARLKALYQFFGTHKNARWGLKRKTTIGKLGYVGVWSQRSATSWDPHMEKSVSLDRWDPRYDWGVSYKHMRREYRYGPNHHQFSHQRHLKSLRNQDRSSKMELLQDILRTRDLRSGEIEF